MTAKSAITVTPWETPSTSVPECLNKPWSPEFLNIQAEIESEAEEDGPELIQ